MTEGQLIELALLLFVAALAPNINFFLPLRPVFLIIGFAATMPWLLVASVATLGAILGTLPLYGVAYKATDIRKVHRWLAVGWIHRLLERFRKQTFLLIVLTILTPLPDQLIGIFGGLERYPFRRYLFANLVGRVLFYFPLAYLGHVGSHFVKGIGNGVGFFLGI